MRRKSWVAVMCGLVIMLWASPAFGAVVEAQMAATAPGAVAAPEAGFKLEMMPASFASGTISVRIDQVDVSTLPPSEDWVVTRAIDLQLTSTSGRPLGFLAKPLRLSFAFDMLDFKRASNMRLGLSVGHFRLGYWDRDKNTWVPLPSTVYWNGSTGLVEAESLQGEGRYALLWTNRPNESMSPMGGQSMRLMLDYAVLRSDIPPYVKGGRTMVPLRLVGESLGTEVSWVESQQRIDLRRNLDKLQLWIGRNDAVKNESTLMLETAPEIVKGRTFVPLRFVAEAFGAKVEWDAVTKTVKIFSP